MKAARQFWALTQFALAVAVRLRAGWAIAGAVVALIAGGALLRELHFGGAEARFLVDYAAGVLATAGAMLVALVGPAVFFEGLRSGTTVVLLVHGARRGGVVAAQIAAVGVAVGWLATLCALATIALLGALGHGVWTGEALVALARATGPLLVLAAASVFFAGLARSALLATTLTLALAFAGHLAPVLASASAHPGGMAQAGWTILGWLVPNFGVADSASPAGAAGYFAAYALVYATLAGWVFSRREL